MAIIIEFIGPAGAGKTELAKAAYDYIKGRNCRVFNFSASEHKRALYQYCKKNPQKSNGRAWTVVQSFFLKIPYFFSKHLVGLIYHFSVIDYAVRWEARNDITTRIVLKELFDSHHSHEHREYFLKVFYNLYANYQIITELSDSDSNTVIVMDEAFCQRALSIYNNYEYQMNLQGLSTYLEHIPKPFMLFFIQADPAICLERMQKRKSVPKLLQQVNDQIKFMQNYVVIAESVCERLKYSDVKVCEIQNNSSFEAALNVMKEQIDEYLLPDY